MVHVIRNCRLVSPGVDRDGVAIEIEHGRISAIHDAGSSLSSEGKVFDAGGALAVPGFIDIHFHGGVGFDNTDGTSEAIERIAEAKLMEGVTTICPTTLTLPEAQLARALRAVSEYARNPSFCKVAGVHLEGPFINPACAGAQNPAFVRPPDIEEIRRLNAVAHIAIVSYAVEMEGDTGFTAALTESGIVASCGHTAAVLEQIMAAKKDGLTHMTHFCNQMTKLHHREIGCVGAGLLDDDLVLELICDKIHLSPAMIELAFKAKGCEGIVLITDAMSATGLDDGDYSLGGLEVRVAEGAARLKSNGALAGSTLQFPQALRNVFEVTGLPLSELVRTTSYNQAQSLGLDDVGRLEPGCVADIAVLGPDFHPIAVFVAGERRV